jgi:hypothetical protein
MATSQVLQFQYALISGIQTASTTFNGTATGQGRQGSQLASITITPKSDTSTLLFDVSIPVSGETSNHSNFYGFAIYRDSSVSAEQIYLRMVPYNPYTSQLNSAVNTAMPIQFAASLPANDTNAHTFYLYGGMDGGAMNINGNGNVQPSTGLGTSVSTFTCMEIKTA